MRRRADWQARLRAAREEAATQVFEWARWDCCHFVAACVLAMTDDDPLADYRGGYADEAEAWAALAARDGNLRAACKRVFGQMRPASFARRGDVVMLKGNQAIGICIGAEVEFADPDGLGLVRRPLADCKWCFPIDWPEKTAVTHG